jgi:hypothetical protein
VSGSYIRFTGFLSPTLEFILGQGWETDHIANLPARSKGFAVEVLDAAGAVLAKVAPEIADAECWARGELRTERRLVGYVPLRPSAAAIRVRHRGKVLHQSDVAPEPPTLQVIDATLEGSRLTARWEGRHDRPLTYNVAWFVGRSRAFPLAVGLSTSEGTFEIGHLPGGPECFVAVVATDGLRSASALSDSLSVAIRQPTMFIASPSEGERFLEGTPISLYGQALDPGGEPLLDGRLEWAVDGKTVEGGGHVAAAVGLDPGRHRITLRFIGGGAEAMASIDILVTPVPAIEQWQRMSAWLDEHPESIRESSFSSHATSTGLG